MCTTFGWKFTRQTHFWLLVRPNNTGIKWSHIWALTCQSPWLRKCIQLRWKQHSPRAAAQFHLDSSPSERQACSTHCPDSYLCNCLPVREEHWHRRCLPPTPRQEICSNGDSGVLGPLVHCQERCGCRFVNLTCIQEPSVVSHGYHWMFKANRAVQVYWHVSHVQVLMLQKAGTQAKSVLTIVWE